MSYMGLCLDLKKAFKTLDISRPMRLRVAGIARVVRGSGYY
jgi:hypothetical protein